MGKCFSRSDISHIRLDVGKIMGEEQAGSIELDAEITRKCSHDQNVKRLLLLGAGESGKSTLFRQMKLEFGTGFSQAEFNVMTSVIRDNVIYHMKAVCAASKKFSALFKSTETSTINEDQEYLLNLDIISLDESLANRIERLWKHPDIQQMFELRSKYHVPDSAAHFFDDVQRVAAPDYCATQQDMILSRVRTTGINEAMFRVEHTEFQIIDVGGQKNERKKWLHSFSNITCVLFVAAASEFDRTMFENDTTNRLTDALNLFEETINSQWFQKAQIILVLNKTDLLAAEMRSGRSKISSYFPQYEGPKDNVDEFLEFLSKLFLSRNANLDRSVQVHFTNATDAQNVKRLFLAVKESVTTPICGR